MKNYVIEFCDWDSYNADTRKEAIKLFRQHHGDDAEILAVKEWWIMTNFKEKLYDTYQFLTIYIVGLLVGGMIIYAFFRLRLVGLIW